MDMMAAIGGLQIKTYTSLTDLGKFIAFISSIEIMLNLYSDKGVYHPDTGLTPSKLNTGGLGDHEGDVEDYSNMKVSLYQRFKIEFCKVTRCIRYRPKLKEVSDKLDTGLS